MNRAAHFERVKSLIAPPVIVHDSTAPLDENDGTVVRASYAILYDLGADEPPDDERYAKQQDPDSKVTLRYVVKSVGETPFAAREVDGTVAGQLISQVIEVEGRECDPIVCDEIGGVKEDTSVSPPLYFIESDYLVTSKPV